MSPRIDISIDELPEASSLLDGHDYSSQIIQRIAGVPVINRYIWMHSSLFLTVPKRLPVWVWLGSGAVRAVG